jgi:nicotinamidase-related amidase
MRGAIGLGVPRTLEDVCNPRDLALLVYDMQVGIVKQLRNGAEVVAQVRELLDLARRCSIRVAYTRHMSLPSAWMGAFQYRTAMSWQHVDQPDAVRSPFLRGSAAFEITPELEPRSDEAVFDKLTMSAFEGTPLAVVLRDCGVRAIAIAGIALEVGIEPTARHAADLALIPIVVADACGAGNDDAARRSLAALEFAGDTIVAQRATLRRLLAAE